MSPVEMGPFLSLSPYPNPETNSNFARPFPKRKFIFQPPIFRCEIAVSFKEGCSPNSLLWGLLFKKKRCAQACARLLSWAWLGRGVGVAWACVAWAWRGRGVGVAWARLGRGRGLGGVGVAWAWRGRGLGVAWAWRGRGVGVAWAWRGLRTWSCYCEDLWGVFQGPWPTCYGVNDTDYHHHQQQKQ